ncbi:glycosyltransferase family 4 protein [Antarcticibacterium flavum]|uniref:Glycosyltransferase family 4 protein n=1 Tax=Antarcticibacterium flavum TaxID=2058175 RepID=A0A5B7WZ29_9FLAO|nr:MULTISPECIES: glycosyltransferase family 4 protein [Antarcticibacterium]MCM4158996.1 glycosyl transferase family 1 [Antarcticibacterium sp. W02-3]QCY68247.1 glycosyltransferase family 4 protein [Antarcticibacterium flavum]
MRKVLIITYYWPPAGGPGVQRWLKFVKYLPDFGVEPVVYTPLNPHYPLQDTSLEQEVPNGVEVIKQKILEPYSVSKLFSRKQTTTISSGIIAEEDKQSLLQKMMLFIRGNLFIPDARVLWVKPSVSFLKDYLQKNNIETIITTGPPHSLHLIGLELQKKLKVKWIADFRDPWTNIGYHKKLKLTGRAARKHKELELEVLKSADQIVTTSFTTAEEFRQKTSRPVTVITNGFDDTGRNAVDQDKSFTISHIGSLLSGRNPLNLWQVLGELKEENENFKEDLKLQLTGVVSEEVIQGIKTAGLEKNLELKDYVTHNQALVLQQRARLLLLIEINSEVTRGIIPGKVFEYLAAGRPIIAVGPENWDVNRILGETGAGKVFGYTDGEILKEAILKVYRDYKQGEEGVITRDIMAYSRRNLSGKMASLIKVGWE